VRTFTTAVVIASLVWFVGCSSPIRQPGVCASKGCIGYLQDGDCSSKLNTVGEDLGFQLMVLERERDWLAANETRLVTELEAAKRQNIELERQVDLTQISLAKAEQDLLHALQSEITRGTLSVQQSGETLAISLDSSFLFEPGQDQLKAGGADVLRRVGACSRISRERPSMWQVTPTMWPSRVPSKINFRRIRNFPVLVPRVRRRRCATAE